ncbi:MAG: molybdenum ABC transporter ATP-binding protein [Paracoccaceae bacterium]
MMLEIELHHRIEDFTLDLAFTAPAGLTALFGRSGAGKSTIAQSVAGLLRPERGRIVLGGEVLLDTARGIFVPPQRRRIGYVFQDARLFPHLSVRQNLLYGQKLAPRSSTAPQLDEIAELLGIAPLLNRRPAHLSGGEVARVALGRALLANPRALILDEPLSALDPARKAEILPYLEGLRDRFGLPILYISHAPEELARLATTLVLFEGGQLRAAGPVAEIFATPAAAAVLGPREIGAILAGTVAGAEPDGLMRVDTAGGPIFLDQPGLVPGQRIGLHIHASDVTLALTRPEGISALNLLQARISEVIEAPGASAHVRLDLGDQRLLAKVTRRSVAALGLRPGLPVWALVKSVSMAAEDVTARGTPG